MASLLRGLLSFCQHGHTGTESPSGLDTERQHVLSERICFEEERGGLSLHICLAAPRCSKRTLEEPTRVRKSVRPVCQVVTYIPACSTSPGNFTLDGSPLSSSPSAQFINHICKQGDWRVWPSCSEEPEMGGTVFSQWNSGSCCSKIAWGWPLPDTLQKPIICLFWGVGGKGRMWELFWVTGVLFHLNSLSCWV